MTPADIPTDIILRIVNQLGREISTRNGDEDVVDKIDEWRKHGVRTASITYSFVDGRGVSTPSAHMTVPVEDHIESLLTLRWSNGFDIEDTLSMHLQTAVPKEAVAAKMQELHDACLVTGCCCGCRGDFAVTIKALDEFDLLPIDTVSRYPVEA